MLKFLRRILRIQTLKFVLYNPDALQFVDWKNLADETRLLPILWLATTSINDIKVVDTGIPVRGRTNAQNK